jgi:hypothetical protein
MVATRRCGPFSKAMPLNNFLYEFALTSHHIRFATFLQTSLASLTVSCFALLLAACGSTKAPAPATGTTSSQPSATTGSVASNPAPGKPSNAAAKFKLSKVNVSWLDNPSLPVLNASGSKGSISSGDTARALAAVRASAPRELLNALKAKAITEGGAQSITLMPVGGLQDANGATTAIIIRAIVTHSSSGAQWKSDVELGNRSTALGIKATEAASLYASVLINTMAQAGLLP